MNEMYDVVTEVQHMQMAESSTSYLIGCKKSGFDEGARTHIAACSINCPDLNTFPF